MRHRRLPETQTSRETVDVFLGYNHNLRIGDGEFYDMKNLSSREFPILTPRGKRGIYAVPNESFTGLTVAKEKPCYVDGSDIVIDGVRVSLGLDGRQKQLVKMGAYVLIFPDKKYINTIDFTDCGEMENVTVTKGDAVGGISFQMCKHDGEGYTVDFKQDTAPENPPDGAVWLDTSLYPNALRQYAAASGMWVQIATTYIKISARGIGIGFKKGDGVKISGLAGVKLEDYETQGGALEDPALSAIDGAFVLQDCGDDFLIIIGLLPTAHKLSNTVTVERKLPIMDYVIESGNRLWGCRYGTSDDGEIVNEIYASKLGDFKNWNCFEGISTDSYVVSVGTDGAFTGAVTHLGSPLFFKEDCMHKLYGTNPPFQMQTTACRGVQNGSHRSLAIVNEVLYYKSRNGVCAYDGSLPVEISEALGDLFYNAAVGGSHANKYYISMQDENSLYHLFVYDTKRRVWHKEDNTRVTCFASCGGEMYFIDHDTGKITTVFGSGNLQSGQVEWMAQTGVIGADRLGKKYLSRLNIQLVLEIGSRVNFYVQYDSVGDFEYICTLAGVSLRSFSVPIRPKRCDHLRLRIEGKGEAKIFYIAKTFEQGSDIG